MLGPIVFAFAILARQSQAWLAELSMVDQGGLSAPSWLRATPMVGARLADAWNHAAGTPGGLSAAYVVDPRNGTLLGTVEFPPAAGR